MNSQKLILSQVRMDREKNRFSSFYRCPESRIGYYEFPAIGQICIQYGYAETWFDEKNTKEINEYLSYIED